MLLLAFSLACSGADSSPTSSPAPTPPKDPWGREVQDLAGHVVVGDPGDPERVAWPLPEGEGLHLVGTESYVALEDRGIHAVGDQWFGLTTAGTDRTKAGEVRVVFRSAMTEAELAQHPLKLHQLLYRRQGEAIGPLGSVTVDVGLWIAARAAPIEREALGGPLQLLTAELEPGVYALHTNDALTDATVYAATPASLRRAWPFEIR